MHTNLSTMIECIPLNLVLEPKTDFLLKIVWVVYLPRSFFENNRVLPTLPE